MCTRPRSQALFPPSASRKANRSRPGRSWSRLKRARNPLEPDQSLQLPAGALIEEAGDLMLAADLDQRRRFHLAALHRVGATGVKGATGRRVDRTGHVAIDHGRQALGLWI